MDKKSKLPPSKRRELKLTKRIAQLEEITIELHNKVNMLSMVVKKMMEKVDESESKTKPFPFIDY